MKRLLYIFLCLFVCCISPIVAVDVSPDFEKCKAPSSSVAHSLKVPVAITVVDNLLTAIPCVTECEHTLEVKNGLFRGTNNGEWGGNVTFSATDVTLEADFELIPENCCGFFEIKDKVFAITFCSDDCVNYYGKLYELVPSLHNFFARKVLDINDVPLAFTVNNNILYIITARNLLKFDGKQLYLITTHNWRNFIPSSIVCADNRLFIGLRRGWLCEYNLSKKALQWYQYKGALSK